MGGGKGRGRRTPLRVAFAAAEALALGLPDLAPGKATVSS